MESSFVRRDAEQFFERLGDSGYEFNEVRLIGPATGKVTQSFRSSVADAITIAADASGQLNVYIGANPRFRRRGTRDDVHTARGAWADLDFHQIDPNRDLALELAYRRIEALGMRPTMLVHTGNGLQAWWLFRAPVAVSKEWPAERFEAINNGLAEQLGGDHVHDLARVLRVPGTVNLPDARKRERGCVPVMARLLKVGGPTYAPQDFDSIAITPASSSCPGVSTIEVPREPNPEVVEAFIELIDALDPCHPLSRTWRGDRELADDSRSGWDMAMANQLVRAGIRDEFVPHILRAFHKGRGRLATDKYLARTISKALRPLGVEHATHRNP